MLSSTFSLPALVPKGSESLVKRASDSAYLIWTRTAANYGIELAPAINATHRASKNLSTQIALR